MFGKRVSRLTEALRGRVFGVVAIVSRKKVTMHHGRLRSKRSSRTLVGAAKLGLYPGKVHGLIETRYI